MKKSLPICTRHCRQLVFLVALLTLFVCQSAPAYAREQSGSLQIECKVHHDNDTFFLAGDTYAVVQIATVSVGNAEGSPSFTYQICEAFKAFDCDWDNLTDEELRAKSKALQAYAEKMNLLSIKQTTDQHGQVVFTVGLPLLHKPGKSVLHPIRRTRFAQLHTLYLQKHVAPAHSTNHEQMKRSPRKLVLLYT